MKELLGDYKAKIDGDLDQLYEEHDKDSNGYLSQDEATAFLNSLSKIIEEERAKNYSEDNVGKLFKQFDEDKNGYLEKAELASLVKKVFRRSAATTLPK